MTGLLAWGALPPALSLSLGVGSRWIGRRCAPRATAYALVTLALCAAMSTGVVLCAAACLGISQLPAFARLGDWSAVALRQQTPVPPLVAVLLTVIAAALVAASAVQIARSLRRFLAASSRARALGPAVAGLTVIDDGSVSAYAVPSLPRRPGRTVVSRSALQLLDPSERRALLVHEASHLRHHHALLVQLAEVAAAANPLLRPMRGVVSAAVERWADDDAARAIGDPVPVARAVAKTSVAAAATTRSDGCAGSDGCALAIASESDAVDRVRRLLQPRRYGTGRFATAMAVATIVCVGGGATAGVAAWNEFQRAENVFAAAHRTHGPHEPATVSDSMRVDRAWSARAAERLPTPS